MGRGRTTRVPSAWSDTAFWADEDEDGALRSGKTAESHSKASEKMTGSASKKSKDKKKRRELVDKRLSDSGFELRSREGAGEAAASANQEAPGDAHDQLWDAVQKGKGKIYRTAEEKVRVGPAIPQTLVEMFAESFSLEVVETVRPAKAGERMWNCLGQSLKKKSTHRYFARSPCSTEVM